MHRLDDAARSCTPSAIPAGLLAAVLEVVAPDPRDGAHISDGEEALALLGLLALLLIDLPDAK